MTKVARLAYLTSPRRGVFVLNLQIEGRAEYEQFEISKGQLANIIVDGASFALREADYRSPEAAE